MRGLLERKAVRIILILLCVGLLAFGGFWLYLGRTDRQHARFVLAGKGVLEFLGNYSGALKKAHQSGDFSQVMALYDAGYQSPKRGGMVWVDGPTAGGVDVKNLRLSGDRDFDIPAAEQDLKDYLATLAKVDKIGCKIDLIEEVDFGATVTLTVKYFLLGYDHEGNKVEDRIFYRWNLRNLTGSEDLYDFRLVSDSLVQGVRVSGSASTFAELDAAETGIDFVHQRDPRLNKEKYGDKLHFDVIEHSFGGMSAADYDGDGRPDLFFADGVKCRLYRNVTEEVGKPRFEEVSIPEIGNATSGLFFDFDQDGDQDLFISRYMVHNALLVNDGQGGFEDRGAALGLTIEEPILSSAVVDYDRDGYLDLFLGSFGNTFEAFPIIPFFALNGRPNRLYRNLAGKGFEDVTEKAGVGYTGWTLAVTTGDFNNDGWPDLGVANDFGRKELWRNNKDGTFTEIAAAAGVTDFSGGMGILFADLNNDGLTDLYTSNIKSNQRWYGEDLTMIQYFHNLVRTSYFWGDLPDMMEMYSQVGDRWRELGHEFGEGNSLFINNGDETFTELKDVNANQASWGWGIHALDYDNDRDLDLLALNGWISAKPGVDL